MNLDFLKDFSKIYNLEFSVVLEELIKLIKKELNAQSVFFKGGRLYESYTNLEGVYKERKIKLTTKKIRKIAQTLKDRLIYLSNQKIKQNLKQNLKQEILDKFPNEIVEGEVIAENKVTYIIKINNYEHEGYLYKNKEYMKKKWKLNQKGIFHIRKIKIENNKIVKIYLDDHSPKIKEYIIHSFCVGIYVKKIKFLKDKIFIKSIPKLDDLTKEKLELIFNKKIIRN